MFDSGIIYFTLLAIFSKTTLALSDDHRAHMKTKFVAVGEECLKDYPLETEHLESFGNRIFPAHENAGCFASCALNKLGLFDDKGALVEITALENAKNAFEDDDEVSSLHGFLNTCGKVNNEEVSDGEKGCERAKLAFNCFADNHEKFEFEISFV